MAGRTSKIKVYIQQELEQFIDDYSEKNYTNITQAVNSFVKAIEDILEATDTVSVGEAVEKIRSWSETSSTTSDTSKTEQPEPQPTTPQKPANAKPGNGGNALNVLKK